jgi:3-methyladenine DNA glycosylase/8-oxoguanine DNA glycosylase
MPQRTLVLTTPIDLGRTLGPHLRGSGDPTMRLGGRRVIRATRTPEGAATLLFEHRGDRIVVEAWGPGSDHALAAAPAHIGVDDDREGFLPGDRLVRDLDRRLPGIRIGRTGAILEALVPAILEQKVTGTEAWRGFRGLIARWGEPAPGPFGLRLQPTPRTLAAIPYHELHPFGIERRRADLIRAVASRAERFEEIVNLPLADAYRRLTTLPGIGPWTAAEVAVRALGDRDAVSVGDFHLKNLVAFAFTGARKGTDEQMLELLEPYRGHRARVVRLLEASGIRPPPRGPRLAPRSIASI